MQITDLGPHEHSHISHKEAWERTPRHLHGNDEWQARAFAKLLAIASEALSNPVFGAKIRNETYKPDAAPRKCNTTLSRARNSSHWGISCGEPPQCHIQHQQAHVGQAF